MNTGTEFDVMGEESEVQVGQQQEVQQEPEVKVSETDELRQALAELTGHVTTLAAPKQQQAAPLTEEQKAELWAIYNPESTRKDFMRKFFKLNPDATPEEEEEARAMFKEMQTGLVKQSIVGAQNYLLPEIEKIHKRYAPLVEYVEQQRAQQTRLEFYKTYPAFEEARHGKILELVASQVAQRPHADNKAFFKALAESAAELIKSSDPAFDLGAVTKQKPTAGTAPRLPRSSVGGTGGAGGAGGAKTAGARTGDASADIFA